MNLKSEVWQPRLSFNRGVAVRLLHASHACSRDTQNYTPEYGSIHPRGLVFIRGLSYMRIIRKATDELNSSAAVFLAKNSPNSVKNYCNHCFMVL